MDGSESRPGAELGPVIGFGPGWSTHKAPATPCACGGLGLSGTCMPFSHSEGSGKSVSSYVLFWGSASYPSLSKWVQLLALVCLLASAGV